MYHSSRLSLKQSITQAENHSSRTSLKQVITQTNFQTIQSRKQSIHLESTNHPNNLVKFDPRSLKNTKSLKHLVLFNPRSLNHSNEYLEFKWYNYYSSLKMLSVDLWLTNLGFSWWHDASPVTFFLNLAHFLICVRALSI